MAYCSVTGEECNDEAMGAEIACNGNRVCRLVVKYVAVTLGNIKHNISSSVAEDPDFVNLGFLPRMK